MATQRITIATIGGEAGVIVAELLRCWRIAQRTKQQGDVKQCVDLFAGQLRANGRFPPILYFSEWFDLWSMGDEFCSYWLMGDSYHDIETVEGSRYEISWVSRREASAWADRCGSQFPEQQWLAARLREAAESWRELAESAVVVLLREVLGGTVTDEEVESSLRGQPKWLSLCRTSD